jgi:catechol 2,3-dioxygenase-like lactoylglutathione lyase family enzyme
MLRISALLSACLLAGAPLLAKPPAHIMRPPITGIAWVRFAGLPNGGSDPFYLHELGLPRVKSGATSIFLLSSTQSIQVVSRPSVEPGDQLLKIALYTTSLDRMQTYLASKGVKSSLDSDGLEVLDPEGHHLVFRASGTDAPAAPDAYRFQVSHRLVHAGIIVHDRPAEDRFYHDILGCRLYWQGGYKDGIADWVNMQVPEGSDWIEYMLNLPANADAAQLGGANHISLGVPNIQAAAKLLAENGWQRPPDGGTHLGLDGKWQINLHDALKSRIEVMEYAPVKPPCCSPFTGETPHD